MSVEYFVKGECRHCAGHLEFPAAAGGQTIPCPHCGQPTELRASVLEHKKRGPNPRLLAAVLVALVMAAGTAVLLLKPKTPPSAPPESQPPATMAVATPAPAPVPPVAVAPVAPPPPELKPGEVLTNDFDISPLKLEKTPGSSLVYVTGRVRNLTGQQRFGVKVVFQLFDTNDTPTGEATDYQSVLDPQGYWDFKAMVMEAKTATAKFGTIQEDK